jgi:hypothetical protein
MSSTFFLDNENPAAEADKADHPSRWSVIPICISGGRLGPPVWKVEISISMEEKQ